MIFAPARMRRARFARPAASPSPRAAATILARRLEPRSEPSLARRSRWLLLPTARRRRLRRCERALLLAPARSALPAQLLLPRRFALCAVGAASLPRAAAPSGAPPTSCLQLERAQAALVRYLPQARSARSRATPSRLPALRAQGARGSRTPLRTSSAATEFQSRHLSRQEAETNRRAGRQCPRHSRAP